jgi:hypothetical protein
VVALAAHKAVWLMPSAATPVEPVETYWTIIQKQLEAKKAYHIGGDWD